MKTPIEFLRWLRADGPWVLTAIIPDGGITTRVFTDVDAAGKWAKARNKTANVYYAVNPLRPEYKASKKAKKADVAAMEFLHLDIDVRPGMDLDAIKKVVEGMDTAPSAVILSGGGVNCLWRLPKRGHRRLTPWIDAGRLLRF